MAVPTGSVASLPSYHVRLFDMQHDLQATAEQMNQAFTTDFASKHPNQPVPFTAEYFGWFISA